MLELFWELRQQQRMNDIAGAAEQAKELAGRAVSAEAQVERLQKSVDRLTLICMGMWSLIQDKTDLTEEDLVARVNEIDAEDGVVDGRVTKTTVAKCPKCARPFSTQHARCLYCGHAEAPASAFDAL